VFRRGGSLYDAGLRSRMDEYYNTSAGSAEFNALGNPLGFSTAPACVTGDDSTFVAVVDASVTAARADQLARLLIEGGFLHQRVRTSIPHPPSPPSPSLPLQLRLSVRRAALACVDTRFRGFAAAPMQSRRAHQSGPLAPFACELGATFQWSVR